MQEEKTTLMELWRWKMIRKVADYINQPDDIAMSELKAMIESYRNHYNIKELVSDRFISKKLDTTFRN